MEVDEARRLLRVGPATSDAELRAAFRERLRATHPDLHGAREASSASAATAAVVEAYRLLAARPPDPEGPDLPAERASAVLVEVDGDTVAAELPAGDLFAMLVDVGDRIGDVTHVDADAGLLEILVRFPGHGPCSVVLTLQGRGDGMSEAWCTVETLGGGPPPRTEAVAALLAEGLRTIAPVASEPSATGSPARRGGTGPATS